MSYQETPCAAAKSTPTALALVFLIPFVATLVCPRSTMADAFGSGGDTWVSAASATLATDVPRYAFLVGNDVVLGADVAGDAHLAGFSVATRAGGLGFATLVGSVPVAAVTLVGLPLVPLLVLALIVLWTLGYAPGVHVIATRVWRAFDGVADGVGAKLSTLAVALIVIVALNFIPFVGWLVNLAVSLLGLGAMTLAASERIAARSLRT